MAALNIREFPAVDPKARLQRAHNRLAAAKQDFRAVCDPRPDGTTLDLGEEEFGRREDACDRAQQAFAALIEDATGLAAHAVQEALS